MKITLLHNQIDEGTSKDELDNQIQCEVITRSLWILNVSHIAAPQWISSKKTCNHALFKGGAYIIKSVWEHASKGLSQNSVVYPDGTEDLSKRMKLFSIETGSPCFAESYIDGREYSISILEEVLSII